MILKRLYLTTTPEWFGNWLETVVQDYNQYNWRVWHRVMDPDSLSGGNERFSKNPPTPFVLARRYSDENMHQYEITLNDQPCFQLEVLQTFEGNVSLRSALLNGRGVRVASHFYDELRAAFNVDTTEHKRRIHRFGFFAQVDPSKRLNNRRARRAYHEFEGDRQEVLFRIQGGRQDYTPKNAAKRQEYRELYKLAKKMISENKTREIIADYLGVSDRKLSMILRFGAEEEEKPQ